MLTELRCYSAGMILANQYLDQVEPEVRSAIMGNVGTLIAFRVGVSRVAVASNEGIGNSCPTKKATFGLLARTSDIPDHSSLHCHGRQSTVGTNH